MHPADAAAQALDAAQAIAAHQDGLVTRDQALGVGVSHGKIRSQLKQKHWHRVLPGIYLCGPPHLSQRGLARTGLIDGGAGALMSGRAGFETRKCLPVRQGEVDVTTPKDKDRKVRLTDVPMLTTGEPGCISFRTVHSEQFPKRFERVEGLATTLVPRTLVDLADETDDQTLLKAWKECEFRTLLDPVAIRAELSAHRRPGSADVRRLLADRAPVTRPSDDIRSKRETRFLEIVKDAGLPRPLINQWWDFGADIGCRPDFHWVDLMLVGEVDGGQHNIYPRDREDKVKMADLASVGVLVVPFPDHRLFGHRAWCVRRLFQIAEQRRRLLG